MESGTLLTESTLIRRAAAGDNAAFGEIYSRYLDAIYRFIFYRVGDNQDAEDLTETVFIKAWQALPDYKDVGLKFSSWLYRIAQNTIIDFHRKRATDALSPLNTVIDDEQALSDDPQIPISQVEDASALAQAIKKLTDEQQQIIILRFIEGLSHAEIACIMDRSEGACRMLQNRALVALQQQLNGG
ncbi:MAG: RNA polymerase sigma factor [Chloroflexi bacterium]|mgnify:CR=1 FL=1|nr:RNA polymerase sigma factor [Chloroflexota bacterium]